MAASILALALLPAIGVWPDVAIAQVNSVNPVRIVVSIDILRSLVSPIVSGVGEVYSIVSGEVEPHGFTLKPSMIAAACESDLLIITGHMEWEEKMVEEVAKSRGVSADLISINLLKLNGIIVMDFQGERNVHGFWLLPDNALRIAGEVKERISILRPELSQKVAENYERFRERIIALKNFLENISTRYDVRGKSVIIGFYSEMYIAELLGLKADLCLIGEEGGSPEALRRAYEGLKSGEYACIIVSDVALLMENAKRILEEVSGETGCSIAYVLTVSSGGLDDYTSIIYYNVGQVCCALLARRFQTAENPNMYFIIIMILSVIVVFEAALLIRRRVRS